MTRDERKDTKIAISMVEIGTLVFFLGAVSFALRSINDRFVDYLVNLTEYGKEAESFTDKTLTDAGEFLCAIGTVLIYLSIMGLRDTASRRKSP